MRDCRRDLLIPGVWSIIWTSSAMGSASRLAFGGVSLLSSKSLRRRFLLNEKVPSSIKSIISCFVVSTVFCTISLIVLEKSFCFPRISSLNEFIADLTSISTSSANLFRFDLITSNVSFATSSFNFVSFTSISLLVLSFSSLISSRSFFFSLSTMVVAWFWYANKVLDQFLERHTASCRNIKAVSVIYVCKINFISIQTSWSTSNDSP